MKARIKQWIRRKKEAREMDDLQGMEAYRLSVILVSQLKVRHSEFYMRLKREIKRSSSGFNHLLLNLQNNKQDL